MLFRLGPNCIWIKPNMIELSRCYEISEIRKQKPKQPKACRIVKWSIVKFRIMGKLREIKIRTDQKD